MKALNAFVLGIKYEDGTFKPLAMIGFFQATGNEQIRISAFKNSIGLVAMPVEEALEILSEEELDDLLSLGFVISLDKNENLCYNNL